MARPGLGLLRRFVGPELLPAREAYALWAETYPPRPHNPLMEVEQSIVAPLIHACAPKMALDVGTGTGRYLPVLKAAGACVAVGADLSLPMLERGCRAAPRLCADACSLPFIASSFDLVCSSLMAGDLEHLGRWVLEVARVLAPGGHLVYSDFHPAWVSERWRRTFTTASGRQVQLGYFPHSIDEHLTQLESAGLAVRAIREPRAPGCAAPVVVVFHAVKSRRRRC
jgi:SAM-dependent methyltransferase